MVRAKTLAIFAIGIDRSSEVIKEHLGRFFKGIIGCDFHGAYRKYVKFHHSVKIQFCMAHLKRNIQLLVDPKFLENLAYT
ncbi:MAG: transposase [Deltaproteobacteria bacterium]|nr:transposase [Deltaproteobacteria bacterium]